MLLMLHLAAAAQPPYANDVDFVVHKIATIYPGYAERTSGMPFASYVQMMKNAGLTDTFHLLSRLTAYFHDEHLVVYDLNALKQTDTAACATNLAMVHKRLEDPKICKEKLEGYWRSEFNNCIVGIIKVPDKEHHYKGYVMAATSGVLPGTPVIDLHDMGDKYVLMDYTDVDFGYRMCMKGAAAEPGVMRFHPYNRWMQLKGYTPDSARLLTGFDYSASLYRADSNTIVVRIPENNGRNTRIVDSLVQKHHEEIIRTKNLVIDVRYNIGGTVRTYFPLLPYLYTQPIIRPSDSLYCSEEYITWLQDQIASRRRRHDTTNLRQFEKTLSIALKNKNRYVLIPGDTLRYDSISRYPENVAIVTNYATLSAAEFMLLDCKQSSKVTTFGETTGGAVDYPDFFPLATPSGKYVLYIPATKRALLNGSQPLDATGIRPDVFIPETVPDWIAFISAWYEKHQ